MERALLAAILAAALAGCTPEMPEVSGARAFAEDCAACHGPGGEGDGPLAEGLETPPPDLTRLAARNGGTFPRDEVLSVIDGFNRGGHFSDAMPEFGERDLGPTVIVENPDGTGTPIPARLLALSEHLESIQE